MKVIGVRCSPTDFTYCIMEGTKANPTMAHKAEVSFPKSFVKPQVLRWLLQEVEDLLKKYQIDAMAIKIPEGMASRDRSFVVRIEYETIFVLAGSLLGVKPITQKVKATIAKDLGQKGKAHYLSAIDTSVIPAFASSTQKAKEAILAGWSELL